MSMTFLPVERVRRGRREGLLSSLLSEERERELPLILKIQTYRNKALDFYFQMASVLGDEVFLISFLPFCSWTFNRQVAVHLTFLLAFAIGGGNMLKNFIQSPRPPKDIVWVHKGTSVQRDPGFPSTHTMTAFTLPWYILLYYYQEMQMTDVALSIMGLTIWSVSIAISRIYNGHHYIFDVVGGMVLSVMVLATWMVVIRGPLDRLIISLSPFCPLFLLLLFSFLLYIHPTLKELTPGIPESGLAFGTATGTATAAWFHFYTGIPFGMGIQWVEPYFDGYALGICRFLVGMIFVASVKELAKRITLPILLYLFNYFPKINIYNIINNKIKRENNTKEGKEDNIKDNINIYTKLNYKCTEVETVLKYIMFFCIGFTVVEVVPHICWMVGMGHPLDKIWDKEK